MSLVHAVSIRRLTILATVVTALCLVCAPVALAGTSSITGFAYQDLNRNASLDPGEAPMSGQRLYLFNGAGTAYLGSTVTDAGGSYSFGGLTDGSYRVNYEAISWEAIRNDWVPTTTGSIRPERLVGVAGTARADFGWRPIVRSTTLGSPIFSYVGSNGLRVESYDDAVTARELYDDLMTGSLVGVEGSRVTIRFDIGSDATATGVSEANGRYSGYSAASYVSYTSWLDGSDRTLFHEYGHAWSLYYAYEVQQDANLTGYLQVRGLAGDSRVNSSYGWSAREMIAEDYRQLFGSATAAAADQMNRDIPLARDVAGLREYLSGPFLQALPSDGGSGGTTPPPPAPSITGLKVSPQSVSKSGTVTFVLSIDAAVTVEIRNGAGTVVRRLLANVSKAAGTVSAVWDRKDAAGRRVKAGTYTVAVQAVTATGGSAAASATFNVV